MPNVVLQTSPGQPQPFPQSAPKAKAPIAEAPAAVEAPQAPVESPEQAQARQYKSQQLIQKAQAEKARRANEIKLRQREQEMANKEKEYAEKYYSREKILSDPLAALSELGVPPEQLAQYILNQPQGVDKQVLELKAELKALRDEQQKVSQNFEQSKSREVQEAEKHILYEAKTIVDTDPRFETIKDTGYQEAVAKYVIEHYNETGYLISTEEAAHEIENYLVDYYAEESSRVSGLKKVRARLDAKLAEAAPKPPIIPEKTQPQLKTLTQNMSANQTKAKSAKERRERAIMVARGELIN